MCGRAYSEYFAKTNLCSFENWLLYSHKDLLYRMDDYTTVRNMISILKRKEYSSALKTLVQSILPAYHSEPINTTALDRTHIKILIREGFLYGVEPNLQITSPLVYRIALMELFPVVNTIEFPHLNNILAQDPISPDAIPKLIIEATKQFAKNLATSSVTSGYSEKHVNSTTKIGVALCESFYHCELYAVLRSWITTVGISSSLYTNVNASSHDPTKNDSRLKLDLLLISNGKQYCLELLATAGEPEIIRHFDSITKYTVNMKPYESWLIHYTMSTNQLLKYAGNPKIKQLNIRHDLEWKNFTYWYTGLTNDIHFTLT